MKKTSIALILCFSLTSAALAQNETQSTRGVSPIAKGQAQLNLGLGFSNWGLPVYLGFDYGVHKDVTLGAELSFRSYNERFDNQRYNHSVFGISGNVNYHFNSLLNISPKWDLYAGLNIGFYHWNSSNNYPGRYNSGLGLGLQVGGRYYFTDRFGLNLEIGGGNAFSGGKLGISLKL
ncbi:MAG: outer membrane beta-barrel protein [Salibacteraceae bacterium]